MNRGQELAPIIEPTLSTITSTTSATTTTLDDQVVARERMAPTAFNLASIDGRRTTSAKYVLGVRNWLQMIGVYTKAGAAQVVDSEAIRYGANKKLINEAVGR